MKGWREGKSKRTHFASGDAGKVAAGDEHLTAAEPEVGACEKREGEGRERSSINRETRMPLEAERTHLQEPPPKSIRGHARTDPNRTIPWGLRDETYRQRRLARFRIMEQRLTLALGGGLPRERVEVGNELIAALDGCADVRQDLGVHPGSGRKGDISKPRSNKSWNIRDRTHSLTSAFPVGSSTVGLKEWMPAAHEAARLVDG